MDTIIELHEIENENSFQTRVIHYPDFEKYKNKIICSEIVYPYSATLMGNSVPRKVNVVVFDKGLDYLIYGFNNGITQHKCYLHKMSEQEIKGLKTMMKE